MLKHIATRVTCIALMVILDCTYGQIIHELYQKHIGSCSRDSLLWTDTDPRSIIQCVLECKQSDRCYTITIGNLSKPCMFYGIGQDCTLSSDGEDFVVLVKSLPDSLGCYRDVGDSYRALSHRMTPEVPGMTPAICMAYCSDKGYVYAGVQYGAECYCGSADDQYDRHGAATNCNVPCAGDGNQICGGEFANTVYKM